MEYIIQEKARRSYSAKNLHHYENVLPELKKSETRTHNNSNGRAGWKSKHCAPLSSGAEESRFSDTIHVLASRPRHIMLQRNYHIQTFLGQDFVIFIIVPHFPEQPFNLDARAQIQCCCLDLLQATNGFPLRRPLNIYIYMGDENVLSVGLFVSPVYFRRE